MNEHTTQPPKGEVAAAIVGAMLGLTLMVAGIFFTLHTWTDAFTARDKQLCTGTITERCVVQEQAVLVKVYKVVSTEADPMECAGDIRLKDGTVRERINLSQAICKDNPNNKVIDKGITIHRWGKDTLLEVTIDGRTIQIYEGPRFTMMFSVLAAWLGYLVLLANITRAVYLRRTGKAPRRSSMLWTGTVLLAAFITGLVINVSPGFASLYIPLALSMAVFELYTRQTKKWNER